MQKITVRRIVLGSILLCMPLLRSVHALSSRGILI